MNQSGRRSGTFPAAVLPIAAILLVALAVLSTRLAIAVVSRAEHSRDCVMCHIEWGDDYDKLEPMLAPPGNRVMIDGQPARNSSADMCWSCHDAYVCDDRDAFLNDDPHMVSLPAGSSTGDLPLDLDGKVYCGTCHTPHSHTMGRKYEMSPFLRGSYLASELCLKCHSDHGSGANNHPLHKTISGDRGAALAGNFAPRDRVECLSCHEMHSIHSTRLTVGENQTALCASCHKAQLDVMDTRHFQPANKAGACAACHSVHDGAALPSIRGDAACQRCHGAGPGHGESGWGHPLGVSPVGSGGLPLQDGQVGCASCHDPHRWSAGLEPDTRQPGTPATSFLRRPDQAEAGICQGCHPNESAILASDHGAGEPGFSFSTGESIWRCSSCHDAHGRNVLVDLPDMLVDDNRLSPATRLCLRCHGGSHGSGTAPTSIGEFSHPIGRGIGALRPTWLPRGTSDDIGCETCHDPHQWSPGGDVWTQGVNGDGSSSFLRADNREGALCMDCHADQSQVLGSAHDRRGQQTATANACAVCHSPHQAATPGLLSKTVAGLDLESLLPSSDWPPESREHQFANWTEGAIGCLACHHDSDSGQRVPAAWVHPAWKTGPLPSLVSEKQRDLQIDCRSCHDPHQPWAEGRAHARVQFLTAESSETLCATCHGEETLWRYNYFHDPERRHP